MSKRSAWARPPALDLSIDFRQTNHEGMLVDWIHEAREAADGIILNAGAFTHTSVAILDALKRGRSADHRGSSVEHFPARAFPPSFLCEPRARGVICGLGPQGYELALEALASMIEIESSEAPR